MAYAKQTWLDFPDTTTPTSAARFQHMEDGIAAAHDLAGGLGPPACLVVSQDMPPSYIDAAEAMAAAGESVWVCDGTNDQVQINQAIDRAAALNARNPKSPAGAEQRGRAELTGGRFVISQSVLMRTGVQLAGQGELTEVMASALSGSTGYPTNKVGMVKLATIPTAGPPDQNEETDHAVTVRDLWLNGNYAAGGSCSGIIYAGPGGASANYPNTNPDPSMHIRDVRLTWFTTGTRHGIWLFDNCRAGHYSNIWVRDCSGNGLFADSTPDSVLTGSDFGGCGTGVRLVGANWRLVGVKTYYAGLNGGPGIGFYLGSGRHTITGIESQDDEVGVHLAGIKNNLAGVTVDCASTDGLIVGGSRNSIMGFAVYQRDEGEYLTTDRGITFAAGLTDLHMQGWVQKLGGGGSEVLTTISGPMPTAANGNEITISDDSGGGIPRIRRAA